MNELTDYMEFAASLLSDLRGWTHGTVPRQQVLADWLEDFLGRAGRRGYTIEPADLENLNALDDLVRINRLPTTAHLRARTSPRLS